MGQSAVSRALALSPAFLALACGGSNATNVATANDGGSPGGDSGASIDGSIGPPPGQDAAPITQPDGAPLVTPEGGPPDAWLHTANNRILRSDGSAWHGRGANLQDPRGCSACTGTPDANEVNRRMDELISWGANFVRLTLESTTNADTVVSNAAYLAQIQTIVAHAASKPDVHVLLSIWNDPTLTMPGGLPTDPGTVNEWKVLAKTFATEPHVLFGVVNEPASNSDGSLDAQVWGLMNTVVDAIRTTEGANGTPAGKSHIVTVQGTREWARVLDYYVTHPITAGGGANIAYETHVYDAQTEFAARFVNPGKTLPVIIGEFGPVTGTATMTVADCNALMDQAKALEIPHLAWTFHMRCPPSLLVDNSNGGCGIGMALAPSTDWGVPFKARLGVPW